MKDGESMLLGPKDVSQELGCKLRHAYTIMRQMRHVNIGTGQKNQKLRIYKEDLDAYIARQTIIPGKASRETAKGDLTRQIRMKNGCTKIPRRTD